MKQVLKRTSKDISESELVGTKTQASKTMDKTKAQGKKRYSKG